MTRWQFYLGLLVSLVGVLAFSDIGADWMQDGWAELELWLAQPILRWRSAPLTLVARGLTSLGSFAVLTLLVMLCLVQPAARLGGRDKAVLLTLSMGQGALNSLLKSWFGRPRPGLDYSPLVEERYYSFPSGHSMSSLCIYGFLCYLWVRKRPSQALPMVTLTAALVVLVGISRVYLSAHFPGDVLGGFAAGWPCLFLAMVVHAGLKRK